MPQLGWVSEAEWRGVLAGANAISNKLIVMLVLTTVLALWSPKTHFSHCFIQPFLGKEKATLCYQGPVAAALGRDVKNNISDCKK